MDDRRPLDQRDFDDLARAATAARRLAVPDRDQHVAMGDRRPPGHDVSGQRRSALARQFERPAGLAKQSVEPVARRAFSKILRIVAARERQHRAERELPGKRDARRDLVGAFGQWRHQAELWRAGREDRGVLSAEPRDDRRDLVEHRLQPCGDGRILALQRVRGDAR